MNRMTHPDNPAHEISVLDEHVERYASQGWRFTDALPAPKASATDGDD